MNKPNRLFVKTSLSLLSLFLVLANGSPGSGSGGARSSAIIGL